MACSHWYHNRAAAHDAQACISAVHVLLAGAAHKDDDADDAATYEDNADEESNPGMRRDEVQVAAQSTGSLLPRNITGPCGKEKSFDGMFSARHLLGAPSRKCKPALSAFPVWVLEFSYTPDHDSESHSQSAVNMR